MTGVYCCSWPTQTIVTVQSLEADRGHHLIRMTQSHYLVLSTAKLIIIFIETNIPTTSRDWLSQAVEILIFIKFNSFRSSEKKTSEIQYNYSANYWLSMGGKYREMDNWVNYYFLYDPINIETEAVQWAMRTLISRALFSVTSVIKISAVDEEKMERSQPSEYIW